MLGTTVIVALGVNHVVCLEHGSLKPTMNSCHTRQTLGKHPHGNVSLICAPHIMVCSFYTLEAHQNNVTEAGFIILLLAPAKLKPLRM